MLASIDQRHPPVFRSVAVNMRVTGTQIDGHVGHMFGIIEEIFLDHVALVTKADDEIIHAMCGVKLHDVPQNRFATDFDHGFGAKGGFLRKAGSKSPGKDDRFHGVNLTTNRVKNR
jgi:hypothetical protein